MINYNHEIRVRNVSADICSLFENLLDKYDIVIPDDERLGDDDEARIFGETYSILEDDITDIITKLCKMVKDDPAVTINFNEY